MIIIFVSYIYTFTLLLFVQPFQTFIFNYFIGDDITHSTNKELYKNINIFKKSEVKLNYEILG